MKYHFLPRRGSIAILSACLLVVLLGMVAFAVDLGYIAYARTELQRTADACALAAAAELPDEAAATSAALAAGHSNSTQISLELDAGDVQFGYWDRDTATFTTPAPIGRSNNAVRITVSRTEAEGTGLALFFGRVLGKDSTDIVSVAIASTDRGLCGPFIGIESLTASGNVVTDSFDSREGPYDPDTAADRGGLCSDGPLTLNGGVYIRGDVRAGRGYSVTIHGASAVITGNVGSRVKPLNLPAVDVSLVETDNDNHLLPPLVSGGKGKAGQSPLDAQRNFTLTGTTVYALPPGTYYFNDMTLSGQSVLDILGETVIYLTGDLRRAGGTQVNNNTQIAANLRIYSTGGDVDITSDNNFYGVIYAPASDVDIGGTADYFGAIVGRNLTLHGDAIAHYDESLELEEVELPSRTTLVQ